MGKLNSMGDRIWADFASEGFFLGLSTWLRDNGLVLFSFSLFAKKISLDSATHRIGINSRRYVLNFKVYIFGVFFKRRVISFLITPPLVQFCIQSAPRDIGRY